MSVISKLSLIARFTESSVQDLVTGVGNHALEYPGSLNPGGEYASGTSDSQQDMVWSDRRTVSNGTPDDIDLAGALSGLFSASLTFVEVIGIAIINRSTTAAEKLTVGNDGNAAFSGLFGAATHTITVPASGCWFWFSPLDGQGLAITGGTADILQVASASGDVTYDIVVWGRSA